MGFDLENENKIGGSGKKKKSKTHSSIKTTVTFKIVIFKNALGTLKKSHFYLKKHAILILKNPPQSKSAVEINKNVTNILKAP